MLQIRNLVAGYGPATALHGVDLAVGDDEAVAIVGANGAGKSTLVRAVCGLVRPTGGQILMDDRSIEHVPPHRRAEHGIAVVLEGRNLFGELTVRDNLRLAEAAGKRERDRTHDAFSMEEIVDLFPVLRERMSARVELLSGGQQHMVAVARALLLQPRLLVLDELTTGLAPKVVKEILSVLTGLRARGMALLLVEQSIGVASEMTDRAYVLSLGRVVAEIGRGEWGRVLSDDTLVKAYLHG